MSESAPETAAMNGTVPGPAPDAPCDDCATGGEKALAVVAAVFGLFVILVAVDMFMGGKLGGYVRERVPQ